MPTDRQAPRHSDVDDRTFVGRSAELGELRRALETADAGRPQFVLVTGPAGVGKSSLVEQVLAVAGATNRV